MATLKEFCDAKQSVGLEELIRQEDFSIDDFVSISATVLMSPCDHFLSGMKLGIMIQMYRAEKKAIQELETLYGQEGLK